MFNFQNMNDYEFELLCKDILETELNKKLRTYSKGRDGGIDISCFIADDTIVQVKHYINSTYSSLLLNLKKELEKIKALNPNNYYVCTPLRLTPKNIKEIYILFKNYMPSLKNIYDGIIIDDYLSKESNIDIVHKHYKLWLTSSNVLDLVNNRDIFIDTEELMFGIEKEIRLFVETKAYHDSIELLDKENLIIILGDPGVGKTTISKMLLLYYSKNGYKVRYVSDNSIRDIKKVLSRDLSKKEIILMDDFLGQHYLNLKEEQPNEIKSLISYILRNNNKKLILNSRITILNEALRRSYQLKYFIYDNAIKKYIIDLNQMPVFEKAKIFYNHIYFNSLPVDYFNDIKKDKRYIQIIDHKNYNPRVIEHVTKARNYKTCNANKYFDYIVKKLENPSDVWDDEFKKISNFDRLFMHTLYSLTDTFIEEIILKKCYNKRIKHEPGYDSTRDMFSECLIRLTESMVRIIEERGVKKIGVINPSINDYIFHYFENNENEIEFILNYSLYIEQSNRISKINERKANQFKISMLSDNKFLSMKVISKTIGYHYLESIYNFKYKSIGIQNNIISTICDPKTYYNIPRDKTSKFLCDFFTDTDIFNYYNLCNLLLDFNNMKTVFDELLLEDINIFLSLYKNNCNKKVDDKSWVRDLELTLEEYLHKCVIEEVESSIEDNLQDVVTRTIENADKELISDYYSGFEGPLTELIKDILISEIDKLISSKKHEIDNELFSIDLDISLEDILYNLDYASRIDDYFREEPDYDYKSQSSGQTGYEEVHKMFNREYSSIKF